MISNTIHILWEKEWNKAHFYKNDIFISEITLLAVRNTLLW